MLEEDEGTAGPGVATMEALPPGLMAPEPRLFVPPPISRTYSEGLGPLITGPVWLAGVTVGTNETQLPRPGEALPPCPGNRMHREPF